MDGFIYVAASGSKDIMLSQTIVANNLANASTPGFREDLDFSVSNYLNGTQEQGRVFPGGKQNLVNLTPGQINATNRSLDIAINAENGWMAVVGHNGVEGYSRRGDLRLDEYGQLINGAGNAVLGEGGPIAIPPYSQLEIGVDGTISIVPLGQDPNTLVTLDRIKLVKAEADVEMAKSEDGLLRALDGQPLAEDASIRIITGSLESSNVSALASMVDMIDMSRRFEYHQKMISTAESMDRSSAEMMKLS